MCRKAEMHGQENVEHLAQKIQGSLLINFHVFSYFEKFSNNYKVNEIFLIRNLVSLINAELSSSNS